MTCVAQDSRSAGNGGTLSATATYTAPASQTLLLIGGNGQGSIPSSGATGGCGWYGATKNGTSISLSQVGGCAATIITVQAGDIIRMVSSVQSWNQYVEGGGHAAAAIYRLD